MGEYRTQIAQYLAAGEMSNGRTPLLTVVIPTYKRGAWLTRAVKSTFECQGDDVEVIVVPNGPHELWRDALTPFVDDKRVIVRPLTEANGNIARTYGLQLARGKYVRFLDDDDYFASAASQQLEVLESTRADICSGRVMRVDQSSEQLGLAVTPDTNDFVEAACEHSGLCLPVSCVYRREAIEGAQWDPQFRRAQDYVWMLDIATRREMRWAHVEQTVGIWYQHNEDRVSTNCAFKEMDARIPDRLVAMNDSLSTQGRQTDGRRRAIAQAIWHYVHRGFPYHPKFWSLIAVQARSIAPAARPKARHFHYPLLDQIPPLAIEWTLLPARRLVTAWRDLRRKLFNDDYRRTL